MNKQPFYDLPQGPAPYRDQPVVAPAVDPTALRVVILGVGMGAALLALLGALFWTQIASANYYGESLEHQSIRRIRLPALRGKIFDRNGAVLVDNRPNYHIVLYIGELRRFRKKATVAESVRVARETIDKLCAQLGQPSPVRNDEIEKHIRQELLLPLILWRNVSPEQAAVFAEKCTGIAGADLQAVPMRRAIYGSLAAHALGYVQQTSYLVGQSREEYDFYLPDMVGRDGVERVFDEDLRGAAGAQTVQVDAGGFRRRDLGTEPVQAGSNLVLALDAGTQHVVERVLAGQPAPAACVVLDPRTNDVRAIASHPTYDLNWFSPVIPSQRWSQLNENAAKPLFNRPVGGRYAPGSIFKIATALAGLESGGMTVESRSTCSGVYHFPSGVPKRCWSSGGHGDTDFINAIKHSCDVFFYEHGIATGARNVSAVAQRFGLGQATGIATASEARGTLPFFTPRRDGWREWYDGDTANFAIGQGPIEVTPLQMAVMTATVANGGRVLTPRLALRVEAADENGRSLGTAREIGVTSLGELGVAVRSLELVRSAMLQVVESRDGSGHRAGIVGVKVAGKTGTAEVKQGGQVIAKRVWFVAFAPYENPRVALALMVENGDSGGKSAAPLAGKILAELFNTKPVGQEGGSNAALGD